MLNSEEILPYNLFKNKEINSKILVPINNDSKLIHCC